MLSANKNFVFIPASGWLVCGAGRSRTEAGHTGDTGTASRDVCRCVPGVTLGPLASVRGLAWPGLELLSSVGHCFYLAQAASTVRH